MPKAIKFKGKDRDVLVEALKNPPPASPKVVEALRRYQESLKRRDKDAPGSD